MKASVAISAVAFLFVFCFSLEIKAESISKLQLDATGQINAGETELAEQTLMRALEIDVLEESTRIKLARLLADRKAWGSVGLLLKQLRVPWNPWNIRAQGIIDQAAEEIGNYVPLPIPADGDAGIGKWKNELKSELQWYLNFGPINEERILNPEKSPVFADMSQALTSEMAEGKRDYEAMKNALKKVFPKFTGKLADYRKSLKFRWQQWELDSFMAVSAISIEDERTLKEILEQSPAGARKIFFLLWMQDYAFAEKAARLPRQDLPVLQYMTFVREELKNYDDQAPLFKSIAKGLAVLETFGESEENKRQEVEQLDFAECEKRAAAGDMYAQTHLAGLYSQGINCEQDFHKAEIWYGKAASLGDVIAQYQLGMLYEEGKLAAPDLEKAFSIYLEAAKKGHASAQARVAKMLTEGRGTRADPQEGRAWMVLSNDFVKKMAPDEFRPVLLKKMSEEELEKALLRAEEIRKEFFRLQDR